MEFETVSIFFSVLKSGFGGDAIRLQKRAAPQGRHCCAG
jgi:hypothetical protein